MNRKLKLKKKRLNAELFKDLLEEEVSKEEGPKEVSIPSQLENAWAIHKRLKARVMKAIPFLASNKLMSYLMGERAEAGAVEKRWISWRIRRMKNRPARNPDMNTEIWPEKPVILED